MMGMRRPGAMGMGGKRGPASSTHAPSNRVGNPHIKAEKARQARQPARIIGPARNSVGRVWSPSGAARAQQQGTSPDPMRPGRRVRVART